MEHGEKRQVLYPLILDTMWEHVGMSKTIFLRTATSATTEYVEKFSNCWQVPARDFTPLQWREYGKLHDRI